MVYRSVAVPNVNFLKSTFIKKKIFRTLAERLTFYSRKFAKLK